MTNKKGSHRVEPGPGSSNNNMAGMAYRYIDTAFGGVANRNNIIKSDSLSEYAKRWKTQKGGDFIDCYRTYFQYPKEILDHVKRTGSVRGFNGSCWAKVFPLDIDSENLEESQEKVKVILMRLRDDFDVDLKNLKLYFSGAKGFHIEIPSNLFGGFIPSQRLHEEFKALAKLISENVDLSIYDKVRLWRLPNTINSKSGLYKIPLTADEIFNLTIDEIKEMAKSPRKGIFFDSNMNICESLKRLYEQARQSVPKSNERPKEEKGYERLINGKVSEGERNNTLTSYAGKLKAWNIPEDEAFNILSSMNQAHCLPPLDDREVENIIRSVYRYETNQLEFRTLSWTELIGTEEPELDFLIQDILPVGNLIILAGKPKLGKSLLALLFAISVCMGKQLWDKKVTQSGVLFISTEDGEIRLKKRIWKILGDPDRHNPNCHFYVNNCILTDRKVMDALKAKISELKPKLIILDPLINLFKGKELNSGEDMNQVLRPLQELAKESGACVLVIHHARKSAGDDPIDVIQGSITISGVAD